MNTLGITPLKNGVCMVCQEKEATHKYFFPHYRGFGSAFDMMKLEFYCCDDCDRKRFAEWFNETPTKDKFGLEEYHREREMCSFFESLPVNSQERIWNDDMDSQDWIDLHLGELSDEKKKEYGFDDELFQDFEI